MIYLDSSSLLKLLWNEPESSAVIDAIAVEATVVVSVLAEIESLVQLKAAYLGGEYTLPRLRRLEAQFWTPDSVVQTNTPLGLTDVILIAAGTGRNWTVKADGSVVGWPETDEVKRQSNSILVKV